MKQRDIGMIIKQINDTLEKRTNNELREDGLTLTQSGFLTTLFLSPEKNLTMRELEDEMHVSQPTAFGVVSRLCEKKLVQTYDDENKRTKHVVLTSAGIEKCTHAQIHMSDAEAKLTKKLSDREKIVLRELLEKVCEGLEEKS